MSRQNDILGNCYCPSSIACPKAAETYFETDPTVVLQYEEYPVRSGSVFASRRRGPVPRRLCRACRAGCGFAGDPCRDSICRGFLRAAPRALVGRRRVHLAACGRDPGFPGSRGHRLLVYRPGRRRATRRALCARRRHGRPRHRYLCGDFRRRAPCAPQRRGRGLLWRSLAGDTCHGEGHARRHRLFCRAFQRKHPVARPGDGVVGRRC